MGDDQTDRATLNASSETLHRIAAILTEAGVPMVGPDGAVLTIEDRVRQLAKLPAGFVTGQE